MVDQGNTVIVIEHNLDVVKTSDWIIDMGPEGGRGGGAIVATGTPEQIAAVPESYTGQFLRPLVGRAKPERAKRSTPKVAKKPAPKVAERAAKKPAPRAATKVAERGAKKSAGRLAKKSAARATRKSAAQP